MSRFFKDAVSDSNSSESSSDSESLGSSEAELQRRRRAFQKGGSDDDETSSSDADSSDMSSDEEDDEASHKQTAKASGAARFMRGAADSEDSDSDEDVKRVVKSTRDKRFEDMRGIVKAGNNARKINDWVNVQNGILFVAVQCVLLELKSF